MHRLGGGSLTLWVLFAAFVAAAPACRTDAGAQRPAAVDGDGDGVPDDVDLCPDAPEDRNGLEDWDGCPEGDADRDGIPDPKDECPDDPEDRDAFDDADGCPDPDNDHDRWLDSNDECPNEPETYNGYSDDDGCPDNIRFVRPDPRAAPKKGPILFDEGSAKIRPDAAEILDSIAAFVKERPEARGITIAGYAAPYEDRPVALAAARADAVRRYFVARGVPAQQLLVTPFGAETSSCDQDGSRCEYRRVDVRVPIGR